MLLKHHFVCRLPNGVHARPASLLEEASRGFASEITLFNQRTGRTANAKSVLAVIGTDIRHNDDCELTISGTDAPAALATLADFVDKTLPHCDDPPPACPAPNGQSPLPLDLGGANITVHHGTPVVPGVACGRLVPVGGFTIPAALPQNGVADAAAECRKLEEALKKLAGFYARRLAGAKKKIEVELFKAHRAIARDLEFRRQLQTAVEQRHRTVAGAVADAEAHFSRMLTESGSALLRERTLDIQDVCQQLLEQTYGALAVSQVIQLEADAIVVAESLTPGRFLALNRDFLKGLVLAHGGTTSHTVILARSLGIPTLAGVPDLAGAKLAGLEAIIDADAGMLLTHLTDTARRYYALEQQRRADRQARIRHFASRPATTRDGHRIEVGANIASSVEAVTAFAGGAEGVGLFRTEMLFFDRAAAPDETEQFEAYRRVLEAAQNLPVIIRTLDIGGDKPLDYLPLPPGENPFLGYRALRIYPEFEVLFRTQVRALVRASAHGKLKVLLPMLAVVDEARWVKKIIAGEQAKCAAENIPFDPALPVGAMIEVPAAAFIMDSLCNELDFFSIGSNDLLQFFLAADRANERVAGLYNPLQPAFLRLLKQIVAAARAHKKWIGLCGEIGGQTKYLPLLAGLGLDEISMSAPVMATFKAELAGLAFADCQWLLEDAVRCATADEVAALVGQFASQPAAPLIDPDLVMVEASAATRAEAIKLAVNRLYVLGRTEDSRALEEAVWRREQTYSTGFGHGFAIPHCKSNAVKSASLVLVKLRTPVEWNSLDGQPVKTVILLVMRDTDAGGEDMRIFSKLARSIMHADFRARLDREMDGEAVCHFLREQLGA